MAAAGLVVRAPRTTVARPARPARGKEEAERLAGKAVGVEARAVPAIRAELIRPGVRLPRAEARRTVVGTHRADAAATELVDRRGGGGGGGGGGTGGGGAPAPGG